MASDYLAEPSVIRSDQPGAKAACLLCAQTQSCHTNKLN